jgi:Fic family protein
MFILNVIKDTIDSITTKKIIDIIIDIIIDKLSKTEKEVLNLIGSHLINIGTIDNGKAQEITNKSPVSIRKYLAKFVELGILIPEGKNKGRKYRLNLDILKTE